MSESRGRARYQGIEARLYPKAMPQSRAGPIRYSVVPICFLSLEEKLQLQLHQQPHPLRQTPVVTYRPQSQSQFKPIPVGRVLIRCLFSTRSQYGVGQHGG